MTTRYRSRELGLIPGLDQVRRELLQHMERGAGYGGRRYRLAAQMAAEWLLDRGPAAKKFGLTPAYTSCATLAVRRPRSQGGDDVQQRRVGFRPNGSIVTVMYNSGAAGAYIISVGGKTLQFDMRAELGPVVVPPAG